MSGRQLSGRQSCGGRLSGGRLSAVGRLRRHPALAAGAGLTGMLAALALVSLVWTPYPPETMAITERLRGPGPAHWLGTDHFGRDMLSMIMVGARNAIMVAAGAVAIGLAAGVPLGLLAAGSVGCCPTFGRATGATCASGWASRSP